MSNQVPKKRTFSPLSLKSPQRVPRLIVKSVDGVVLSEHDLEKGNYIVGRSAECNDINIDNELVSNSHLSLERDKNKGFILKDKNSTNGIYQGNKRIDTIALRHGQKFTLGPPTLRTAVTIVFEDPPPLLKQISRYGLYGASGFIALGTLFFLFESSKVDVAKLPSLGNGPRIIYAANLETPLRLYNTKERVDKKISEFSPHLVEALLASEDSHFYLHPGVDPIGVIRAFVVNRNKGETQQGGSTLTQQLARNLFPKYVGRDDTLIRKIREAITSIKLELTYSKDSLLLMYLNRVPMGARDGFEDAALLYFGKSADKLDLSESATLVGMVPAPSLYNPCVAGKPTFFSIQRLNKTLSSMIAKGKITEDRAKTVRTELKERGLSIQQRNKILDKLVEKATITKEQAKTLRGILGGSGLTIQRRDAVLERMVAMGTIDRSQADAVRKSSHLNLSPMACKSIEQTKAPYFYNYVEEELKALLGENIAQEGNMVVETALDLKMQEKAEAALALTISSEGGKHKFTQGGLVTLDSNTGLVKAMVGGFDFAKSAYNRTTAQRQPGSTFKLFAYTAAIESGILPTKTYSCEPMNWEKRDFPGCEHGASGYPDMTTGFALSENITALRVAKDVGLPNVIKTAEKMGIESDLKQKPALVLGESVVTLMEMTGAYSSIASLGVWHKPSAILRVYDTSDCKDRANVRTCRILYDGIKELQATRKVFEPNIANTMTTLMRGVVTKGTGKNASITGMNVAGKTGTTNDNVDLWFIGFVVGKPEVTGIWLGNDDNSPTQGTSAQSAQAWSNYMSSVYH